MKFVFLLKSHKFISDTLLSLCDAAEKNIISKDALIDQLMEFYCVNVDDCESWRNIESNDSIFNDIQNLLNRFRNNEIRLRQVQKRMSVLLNRAADSQFTWPNGFTKSSFLFVENRSSVIYFKNSS